MIEFIQTHLLLKPYHLDITLLLGIICLIESVMAESIVIRKFQFGIWFLVVSGSFWASFNSPYQHIGIYIGSLGMWLFMVAVVYVVIWSIKHKKIPGDLLP